MSGWMESGAGHWFRVVKIGQVSVRLHIQRTRGCEDWWWIIGHPVHATMPCGPLLSLNDAKAACEAHLLAWADEVVAAVDPLRAAAAKRAAQAAEDDR